MKKKHIISTRDVGENNVVVPPMVMTPQQAAEDIVEIVPHVEDGSEAYQLPTYHGKEFVVVIPTWNSGKWIWDTFESLMAQTLDEDRWGVLVIDDGSKDDTPELCAQWGAESVRLRECSGKLHALRVASGILSPDVVIVEVDSDDAIEPEAIEVMSEAWAETPDVVMMYTKYTCHNEDWSFRVEGHSKPSDLTIEGAGWISHLRTFRAKDYLAANISETIRKSTDKETIYRMQELAIKTGREFRFIDHSLYRYRRRPGAITRMNHLDATQARRTALKRRMGNNGANVLTIFSASEGNDSGGPGIFWNRLMKGLDARDDTVVVDDVLDADVVIGNIRISPSVDHQRAWVIRLDGVHFNSRQNYLERNKGIAQSVGEAEGVIYQGEWAKAMADEYCGTAVGQTVIVSNGVDVPEGWKRKGRRSRKKIITCSRWGDAGYARKFKRLEATIQAFAKSGLAKKGYELIVLGQHYLTDQDEGKKQYDGIVFADRVSSAEVWHYLAEAAAFMHLSWVDCCPNGVVEALAAKVPILYCADGVHEIVGSAGVRIVDSPLNHPCDINKPPLLNIKVVADALCELVTLNIPDIEFPDVSLDACIAKYRAFFGAVAEKGPIEFEPKKKEVGPWKKVVASTDDMR